MIVLDAAETRAALPMHDAIDAMRVAFDDDREIPQRVLLGGSLFMPGRVKQHTGMKVVSVVPGNPAGLVAAFGPDGQPLGIVDGPTLTSIRTAAVAGLATDLLAPANASRMVMVGAGAMAADQIAAIRSVRTIESVAVWSRSIDRARGLADNIGGLVVDDLNDAIAAAHIVSMATPATAPLFDPGAAPDALHVNAVGAFTPEMAEVPAGFLHSAFVVVDDYEAAAVEAGDLLQASRAPDLDLTTLLVEPPASLPPRTVFKSVGIASQDIAAAVVALSNHAEGQLSSPK